MKQDAYMKVLFISSGNSEIGISPIVKSQGDSLRNEDVDIDYFIIVGKGLKGYLRNILPLRRHIKQKQYDIIHAHYSLSAFAATLAGCKPLLVSLMGSDIRLGFVIKIAIKLSSLFFWDGVLVKSKDMQENVGIEKVEIIPNGVNTILFKPDDKKSSQRIVGWDSSKKHILFAANPLRAEKNFTLLQKAYDMLDSKEQVELHALDDIPHQDVPKYLNASDVVVLTSLWEGSPNTIKEAMACNRPVVCTDVGDVRMVVGDTPGCYVTPFDTLEITAKLKMALSFSEKNCLTQGRDRILKLGLDSETIAKRIISVYESTIKRSDF